MDVLRLGDRLHGAGQYEQALAPLLRGAELVPDNATVLRLLGVACLLTRRLPEAITWLQRSIAVRPGFARAHFELGLALTQWGHDEAAIAAHRRAIALDPHLVEAHGGEGDALMREGKRDEAVAAFHRVVAAAPGTTFALLCEAKALVLQDRSSEAEPRLSELLARERVAREPSRWRAEAHIGMGRILTDTGRFDEAAAHFEGSIALVPWAAAAHQGLVFSRRLAEADRPVLARLLALLEARDVPDHQRMTLHFSAGKALDDLKDYEGAMRHFDAANRIRRALAPPVVAAYPSSFDRRHVERRVDGLIARFTRDFLARNTRMGGRDETPVLVLGMPRSGTTLTERILSSHPRVGGGGELSFWNEKGAAWADAAIDALAGAAEGIRADYLRVLRAIGPDALRVTDKMTFNFFWVGFVHLLFPNARIVHCRRNPIDTCLSIYTMQFSQNWLFASDRGDLAFYHRQYLRLMEHWRAVIPSDRLLEVDYEDTTGAPEETARKLVAFCGLEWDAACLRPEQNPDIVRTASRWQARQPIYRSSVERWRNYEPWLGELRELAPIDGAVNGLQLSEAQGGEADALLRSGKRDEAVAAYRRAFAAAPDSAIGLLCEAKALAVLGRTSEAEQRLRQLLGREGATGDPPRWRAEAHARLGRIVTETGRFEEATTHFESSIALAPLQAPAYQGLVLSRRLTEADRPLLARILARLDDRDVPDRARMTLHFAAGKALDDLREYADAIPHFDAANRIRRALAPPVVAADPSSFDRRHVESRVDRLIERFTSDFFARHARGGGSDETPILVLGMPRSGTTLTERIVSSHRSVAGGGELAFWNLKGAVWVDADAGPLAGAAEEIRADYLRVLRGIGPDALRVTDKMTFNFLWIGLVHLLFPSARFIHCRRNAIDTCLSIYTRQFGDNWLFASDRGDLAFYYRQYLRLMEHWRAVIPSNRLLEVDYEDTTDAPEETARNLVAFCGLEWDPACLRPESNPDAVKTASRWQARQPIYRSSVERWRNYEPWLGELRELSPGPARKGKKARKERVP